eukprot:2731206-Pleurochrysis_carterae.AAC.1
MHATLERKIGPVHVFWVVRFHGVSVAVIRVPVEEPHQCRAAGSPNNSKDGQMELTNLGAAQ